jgi:hypothetical protein
MTAHVREVIVESEKYLNRHTIDVFIQTNALTLPAGKMKSALMLWAVIAVPALVLVVINPTNSVLILNCSKLFLDFN